MKISSRAACLALTGYILLSGCAPASADCCGWGPAGPLIPEADWKHYTGRPSAFEGNPWDSDPARRPVLSMASAASVKKSAPKKKVVKKAAPKPDPCAEAIRKALREAADTGQIKALLPEGLCPEKGQQVSAVVSEPVVSLLPGAGPVVGTAAGHAVSVQPSFAATQPAPHNSQTVTIPRTPGF